MFGITLGVVHGWALALLPLVVLPGEAIWMALLAVHALHSPPRSRTQLSIPLSSSASSCGLSSWPLPPKPKVTPKPSPGMLMVMSPWLLARKLPVRESPMARPRLRKATMAATPAAMEKTAKSDQRRLRQKLRIA